MVDSVVHDLGVLLDSVLTMKPHINKLVSTCFYHLRRLRQLKRHVNFDEAACLSPHSEPIDYYNSILVGLSTIAPLQRVQNVAARLVMVLSARATSDLLCENCTSCHLPTASS